MTTPAQLRAGRHLKGLSQKDVATASKVSLQTIKRAESKQEVSISLTAVAAIRKALEKAGVIFIDENGDGPGVRLRKGKR